MRPDFAMRKSEVAGSEGKASDAESKDEVVECEPSGGRVNYM